MAAEISLYNCFEISSRNKLYWNITFM